MAKFSGEIPNDLLRFFDDSTSEMLTNDLVEVAGKYVYDKVKSNMKKSFKTTKSLEKGLKLTNVYKTSDDGVNIHIGFYGYDDEGVPIPLKALAREYGTSRGEKKKSFMRKAFKKSEIEQVIKKEQDEYLAKLGIGN